MNKIRVDLNGKWNLYAGSILPAGAEPVGTIRRAVGDVGALVLMPTQLYVQINAGVIRSLPQIVVATAIKIMRSR